jgi:hypothetical protein
VFLCGRKVFTFSHASSNEKKKIKLRKNTDGERESEDSRGLTYWSIMWLGGGCASGWLKEFIGKFFT